MQRAGNVLARIVKSILTRYDANRLLTVPPERAGNLLNKIVRPILNRRYDDANHLLTVRRERAANLVNSTVNRILYAYDANRLRLLSVPKIEESREEREAFMQWHVHDMSDDDIYMSAAFRSSAENQVYLFMRNEYVLLHYAPGTHHDSFLINGPNLIRKGFRALKGTEFGTWEITCAFGSHHKNQAFIFSGNVCAKIEYAPGTTDVKILKETVIPIMFPFLKGTPFETTIDAAFESSTMDEAYIFKGSKYARINYNDRDGRLIATNLTFDCLKNTIFERGIDAAFASHRTDEAYIFNEDSYALINYAHDHIIGGVRKILPDDWPPLNGIFPRKNSTDISDTDDEYYCVDQWEQ